ncbi:MAG: hypothetical protein QOE59_4721 [Actinomycetota bacterium]|nr:hypothetical protein [Actinomycetota bacterium]
MLTGADWDPDLLRDDLRGWVAAELGDPGGVLVVDDTGFLKKGSPFVRSGVCAGLCGDVLGGVGVVPERADSAMVVEGPQV